MNFIGKNTFYGSRNSILNYKNQSFLKSYNRINKAAVKTNLIKDTMNNSLNSFTNSISEKYQNTVYKRSSNYKISDAAFEKALKRLNGNYENNESKLNAKNSTLDLSDEQSFTIKTKSGMTVTLACDKGTVYIPGDAKDLSTDDIKDAEEIGHFLTYLNHDSSGILASISFGEDSIKNMLTSVGIKPGFFEVKSGSGSNKFLMLDNGSIYSEHQVEAERSFYNETDLIKNAGFSKDAVCIIDGKEYKINEEGHFNIPKGVRCVAENMIIKK